jgi:predicted dehydrogenase
MQDGVAVGIVGFGNWGSKHVRVLSSLPKVRQVVVIDSNPSRLHDVISTFPKARAFKDLESALPHVSALVIATPPHTHYELALTALRHGKHILVEKPMTQSTHEAVLLLNEARRSNCVLMTGHTLLFNPAVNELQSRLSQGNLGQIRSVHAAQFSREYSVHGADAVWDLAPHSISVFNHLVGSLPTSVSAWNATASNRTESIHVELQYGEIGVAGFIHISRGGTQKVRTFTVIGTEKSAIYDDLAENPLQMYRQVPIPGLGGGIEHEQEITFPNIEYTEPLVEELRHFLAAIEDRSVPKSSGRDGMLTVAIMEAIDRSRKNQKRSEVYYPSDFRYEIFSVGAPDKDDCLSPRKHQ